MKEYDVSSRFIALNNVRLQLLKNTVEDFNVFFYYLPGPKSLLNLQILH